LANQMNQHRLFLFLMFLCYYVFKNLSCYYVFKTLSCYYLKKCKTYIY